MLRATDIVAGYGGIAALKGVSIEVRQGEIVAILGANGAGKSTLLRVISGLVRQRSGTLTFDDARLDALKPYEIARLGITHCPEGRRVFANMSVFENLEMGAYARGGREEIEADLKRVHRLFPVLAARAGQRAGTLSGGEQQMLALGRALMSRPNILLLDEPSLGLAPILIDEIFAAIEAIRREGTTILLVEQNARIALDVADRGYVLETGRVVMSGASRELAGDPAVVEAYLGGD